MFAALLIATFPAHEIELGRQTFATLEACQAEAREFNDQRFADRSIEAGPLLIWALGDAEPYALEVGYTVRCQAQ